MWLTATALRTGSGDSTTSKKSSAEQAKKASPRTRERSNPPFTQAAMRSRSAATDRAASGPNPAAFSRPCADEVVELGLVVGVARMAPAVDVEVAARHHAAAAMAASARIRSSLINTRSLRPSPEYGTASPAGVPLAEGCWGAMLRPVAMPPPSAGNRLVPSARTDALKGDGMGAAKESPATQALTWAVGKLDEASKIDWMEKLNSLTASKPAYLRNAVLTTTAPSNKASAPASPRPRPRLRPVGAAAIGRAQLRGRL